MRLKKSNIPEVLEKQSLSKCLANPPNYSSYDKHVLIDVSLKEFEEMWKLLCHWPN